MRITFVVPTLNLTGGLRVISIYADLLAKKGHMVTVVSPNKKSPSLKEKIKTVLKWKGFKFQSKFNDAFFLNIKFNLIILDKYRPVISDDVPDSDIIIATFWNTAEWVGRFPSEKGKKIYFIQHYEVHPWLPIERVKSTFYLPFHKITVAQWIADILLKKYRLKCAVVGNAVDTNLFYAPERSKNKHVTFCMMYSQRSYKGSQFAFRAFSRLCYQGYSIKLVVFGVEAIDSVEGLPEKATYYSQPEQDKIREIYSQSDAYLFTSSVEGFGLPILEAMACRTPVIGTRCGAAPDLIKSGGGILVNVGDDDTLLSAMKNVYNLDDDLWRLMSSAAYREAISNRWDDKVREFELELLN